VSFQVAGHQTEGYRVSTDVYEGPLDLLLELIEKSELDITRLALAQVTDQYLSYLHQIMERDPAEVSAFLVIAARLVQIKSNALLPRPALEPIFADEEDPAEALARQLILYKRFKELAAVLQAREDAGLRTYLRIGTPLKIQVRADLTGLTLADLMQAARDAFFNLTNLPPLSTVVSKPRVTIREKIYMIITRLQLDNTAYFLDVISENHSRLEIVVAFLALLELVKRHIVEAQQNDLFGDIELQRHGDWDDNQELELEFGE
jgi:segregation and condensation protein A